MLNDVQDNSKSSFNALAWTVLSKNFPEKFQGFTVAGRIRIKNTGASYFGNISAEDVI